MIISVKLEFDSIRIYFDNVLHLHIKRSELLGIHSWQNGSHNYYIEYTLKGGIVTTEYNEFDKFTTILSELEKIIP